MIATGNKRRAWRTAPLALLALTPKCLLCVASYAGLGAVLGLGGPEMCGAPAGWTPSWAASLAWLGAGLVVSATVAGVKRICGSATPMR